MEERPRILLVEDDDGARATLSYILEGQGYEVVTAHTVQQALDRMGNGGFNVGLLDIRLPDGRGVELLPPFRERHPDMELIMVTGYASTETAIRALNDGAAAYLTKPLDVDQLLTELRRILEKQRLVAEKRRIEVALRRANRALRAITVCNQAVTRAVDESKLLNDVCQKLVDAAGYRLAWIGIADQDDDKAVRPVAQAGYEDGYLDGVEISWSDDERGRGPTGTAIRTGRPVACQNLLTDPDYAPWREAARRRGYASSIALPLPIEGRVMGALNLYAAEPDAFDVQEVELLSGLADDLAHGMTMLRAQAAAERAERALEESERRYRSLFEHVPVGLYRSAPDGRVLDVNPALVEMLGHPDRETALRHHAASGYLNAEDRRRWRALMDKEGVVRNFLTQWRRSDGTPIWVEESARAVCDEEGQPLYYEGAVEDVTERREMERRLRQQERLAAVGRVAGGIAHDFNNFLGTIMVYGDIVRRADDLAPHLVPAVETIIAESARASDLVQQILDFSRPSALKVESVDLVSLLNKALDVLDTTLPEDVDLVTAMEAESCPVEADPTRLHQVVMNLINNARDAMPDGGCLRIALSPLTVKPDGDPPVAGMEPGDWARLTVSDDGVGMTEEVKARIFEPFFTTKGRGEGTGLGLAQVYGIVEQHAGHIDVETEPGVGSAFHVYLPRGG